MMKPFEDELKEAEEAKHRRQQRRAGRGDQNQDHTELGSTRRSKRRKTGTTTLGGPRGSTLGNQIDLPEGLLPEEPAELTTTTTSAAQRVVGWCDSDRQNSTRNQEPESGSELAAGTGKGTASRKKKQQKNVLNFISYVPPAPAPSRKKNLHSAPRLMTWLRDNFEAIRGSSLAKDVVYAEYVAFCEADGKDPMLPSMFGKMVHRAFPGLKSSRTGAKGKAKHCYKGFRLKNGGRGNTTGRVKTERTPDEEEEEEVPMEEEEEEISSSHSASSTPTSSSSSWTSATLTPISASTTSSSSSGYYAPYGPTITTMASGSSSSSTSPSSSPQHSKPANNTPTSAGCRFSSSPTTTSDGYFSSPQLAASSMPALASPPNGPSSRPPSPFSSSSSSSSSTRDLDLLLPHFSNHQHPSSFLDMLHSPAPIMDMPSALPHRPIGAGVPPQPRHARPHQHLQQPRTAPSAHGGYHSNYPPHLHSPHFGSTPTTSSPSSSSSARSLSSPPLPSMTSTYGPCGGPPSPLEPPSSFFFPPYISPLSVPLPFAPSFSFSLPPQSPPPTFPNDGDHENNGNGMAKMEQLSEQPGLDSYSSPSIPSSSSSSPSYDMGLCFERDLPLLEIEASGDDQLHQRHSYSSPPLPLHPYHPQQQYRQHQQQTQPPPHAYPLPVSGAQGLRKHQQADQSQQPQQPSQQQRQQLPKPLLPPPQSPQVVDRNAQNTEGGPMPSGMVNKEQPVQAGTTT